MNLKIPNFLKRKDVLLNAGQMYLNKILNAIIPLFLIPYYNKIFGVEQYGTLIFIQAIVTLLIYFTDFGFVFTATREVSINSENKGQLSSIVSSVIVVKLLLTFLVYLGIIVVSIIADLDFQLILLYSLTFTALALQNFMPGWFFQGMKKNAIITFANLLSKIILVILVLIFINTTARIWLVPLIDSLAYFVFFVVGLVLIYSSFKLKFVFPSWELVISNFKLSKDNFFITLLSWITTGGVLIITEQFVSDKSFGYYSIFTRICYYIFASMHQINLTVFPYFSEKFAKSKEEGRELFRSMSKLFVIFIVALLVGGLLFGSLFFEIFFDVVFFSQLETYIPAFYLLVVWVGLVLLNNFIGLQFFVSNNKDNIYRKFYMVNALICIVACLIITPRLGILGSALATVLGEGTMSILLIRSYLKHSNEV